LLFLACDAWTLWDDMFTRSAIGTDAKGWNGGDAAISAPLPNGRAVFLFGDSYITSVTSEGRRVQLGPNPDPWEPLRHTVFGNTIGVMSSSTPAANNISFFARESGSARDITRVPNAQFTPYQQFFDYASLGLAPVAGHYLWPIGAECYDCSNAPNARLLLAFTEWRSCNPTQETDRNVCVPLCGLTGTSAGPCVHGVALTANVIAKFRNIDQAPSVWALDGSTLRIPGNNTQIQWGSAFLVEGTTVYVYGLKPTGELLVRRTSLAGLTTGSESQWTIWRTNVSGNGTWATGSNAMRPVATNVPSYYTIDKLTRSGTTRYLLTYSQLGHTLHARVSGSTLNTSTQAATWTAPSATTPTLDLMSLDASIRTTVNSLVAAGRCAPNTTGSVPSYRHCGITYHGLAHAEHATNDSLGPQTIPTSYIVTYGPNPYFDPSQPEGQNNVRFGAQDTRYYRPRFTYIDASKLRPWCTTDCWEGIVHHYVAPQLAPYEFDITQVTSGQRFYAALTPQSGTPTMSVEYTDGVRVLRTDACTPSNSPVCHAVPPTGAKVARVLLSGPAGSSALQLRVHHAGSK
jgi:hypothetical protein